MAFAEMRSDSMVENANRLAEEAGVEHRFLERSYREDHLIDEILRRRPDLLKGPVCAFCFMECCPSFRLA